MSGHFVSRLKRFRLSHIRFRLRDITPRGLYARSILIIMLPMVLLMTAVTYIFFDLHWRQVSAKLSEGVAGDIAYIIRLYEDDPDGLDSYLSHARDTTRLSAVLRPNEELPVSIRRSFFSALDRTMQRELSAALDEPFWFDTTRYAGYVDIRVQLGPDLLRVLAYRDRAFATTGHIFILWLAGASLILMLIALAFLRNQVKPIVQLSEAADAFGRGEDLSEFKPAGAREVRRAAFSVIRMRDRIKRHVDQRTSMLAGVSHDLRTPLTRLKLELALIKDCDMSAAKADILEMERMLDGYLAFARGEDGEQAETIDLVELTRSACQAAQSRANFRFDMPKSQSVRARPLALKRAIANLTNNAADHAEIVHVNINLEGATVIVTVEDNGPGIPADQIEEALRPFGRLDAARNQNLSGVGLGLTVARDTARAHGGALILEKSELGGLKAQIALPKGDRQD